MATAPVLDTVQMVISTTWYLPRSEPNEHMREAFFLPVWIPYL
eukprot:CAMPEP_0178862306 /NCGR_PEP_ID=MMETSP0747-20121128/2742_1 /TAXON_ID=913974 /ORGANISM="Nitzschia punctata, Strain CCMP561" /LENGTH=42 /DNA_ID= /DNA_START= /DNA_END= /DNA_ORIENTATION=